MRMLREDPSSFIFQCSPRTKTCRNQSFSHRMNPSLTGICMYRDRPWFRGRITVAHTQSAPDMGRSDLLFTYVGILLWTRKNEPELLSNSPFISSVSVFLSSSGNMIILICDWYWPLEKSPILSQFIVHPVIWKAYSDASSCGMFVCNWC